MELNLRLPGQYFDQEAGLHYNYFRDYDPGVGRYVQSDPIGLTGGLNTYGYALQNSLVYSDPSGLNPLCPALVLADGPAPIGDAACGLLILGGLIVATNGLDLPGDAGGSRSIDFFDEPQLCNDDPPSDDECWERCKHLLPSPSSDLQLSEFRRCWRKCKGTL